MGSKSEDPAMQSTKPSESKKMTKEELLAKAFKPAEDAMKLHPFFTGKVKLLDMAGRVDKFNRRFGKHLEKKAQK